SRAEINVVVQYPEFVARHELARRVTIFASARPWFRKRLWPRDRGKREDALGRNKRIARGGVACSSGRLLRGCFGTARRIVRAGGFLLRAQRRRNKDAQGCCYTPIAHLLLLRTVWGITFGLRAPLQAARTPGRHRWTRQAFPPSTPTPQYFWTRLPLPGEKKVRIDRAHRR